jgi:hypothetical protein
MKHAKAQKLTFGGDHMILYLNWHLLLDRLSLQL